MARAKKKSGFEKLMQGLSGDNKKLVDIIYRAEIKAPDMGISAIEILKKYREKMRINPKNKNIIGELNTIIIQLEKGKDRTTVYADILPEDVILFMKEAEKKNVLPSMIFEKYAPIKAMGEKVVNGVRRKLYVPLVLYVLAVSGLNFMMNIFDEIRTDGVMTFDALPNFILDYFLWINFGIGGLFFYFFILIPEKMPMLKKIFVEIDGMLALSTMQVFDEISYAASEMIQPIRRQFKIKHNVSKKDVDGLILLLYKAGMITDLQAAEIKIETDRGYMDKAILIALDEKKDTVDNLDETIQAVIGNVSMLLLAPPLLMAISVLLGMIMASTRML